MMRTLFSAFALAAAGMAMAALPANAQEGDVVSTPNGVLTNVSIAYLQPVLDDAGIPYQVLGEGDERSLSVTVNEKNILLRPRVCQSQNNCAGLWMLALITDQASDEIINAYNATSPATRAVNRGDELWLDRYLIADHGITRGSLIMNIQVFASTIDNYFQFRQEMQAGQ